MADRGLDNTSWLKGSLDIPEYGNYYQSEEVIADGARLTGGWHTAGDV